TSFSRDWSSDVCSSDLTGGELPGVVGDGGTGGELPGVVGLPGVIGLPGVVGDGGTGGELPGFTAFGWSGTPTVSDIPDGAAFGEIGRASCRARKGAEPI